MLYGESVQFPGSGYGKTAMTSSEKAGVKERNARRVEAMMAEPRSTFLGETYNTIVGILERGAQRISKALLGFSEPRITESKAKIARAVAANSKVVA